MTPAGKARFQKLSKASRSARTAKSRLQKKTEAAVKAWKDARKTLVALRAKLRTGVAPYGKALVKAVAATTAAEVAGVPNYPTFFSSWAGTAQTVLAELEAVIESQIEEVDSALEEFKPS